MGPTEEDFCEAMRDWGRWSHAVRGRWCSAFSSIIASLSPESKCYRKDVLPAFGLPGMLAFSLGYQSLVLFEPERPLSLQFLWRSENGIRPTGSVCTDDRGRSDVRPSASRSV